MYDLSNKLIIKDYLTKIENIIIRAERYSSFDDSYFLNQLDSLWSRFKNNLYKKEDMINTLKNFKEDYCWIFIEILKIKNKLIEILSRLWIFKISFWFSANEYKWK